MSITTLQSRIVPTRTQFPEVRPSVIALFLGWVGDALTTAYGLEIMGTAMESNPIAGTIMNRLWMGTNLMAWQAGAIYAAGSIITAIAVCFVLHRVELPYGRQFTRIAAVVFVASPLINLIAIVRWIAYQPGAGWMP